MTAELNELAGRATACKHWRWMPGMLAWRQRQRNDLDPVAVRFTSFIDKHPEFCNTEPYPAKGRDGGTLYRVANGIGMGLADSRKLTPDFTDEATASCLLALVQEAWSGCEIMITFKADDRVEMMIFRVGPNGMTKLTDITGTRLEVYVRALEEAP